MKPRYRLIVRSARGGAFYCVDTLTKKRTSLKTADRYEAARILHAKNEAAIQPMMNLQIARAYLFGADEVIGKRTWRDAIIALTETKLGSNKERWQRAQKEKAFASLALGHNSKAVHRAYARKAQVTLPPLEDYEKSAMAAPVIPLPISTTA